MSAPLVSSADSKKLWPTDDGEHMTGKYVILEPLKEHHADSLFPSVGGGQHAYLWDWMPSGPFHNLEDFRAHMKQCAESKDVCFWAIKDRQTAEVVGHTSYLRIDPANACVEIGNIMYAPSLQRTTAATEIWFWMADRAFASGFRRLEWKCNAGNAPSRRAALRFGHTFEGVFRQHMIVKGRNRDTAWFSIIDRDWPQLKQAIMDWMDDSNFEESGKQKVGLAEMRSLD